MSKNEKIDLVNQKLPMGTNLIYALQHVFVMVAGAVAVPMMVAGAAGREADQTFLISCALFAAGVATLIQTIGAAGFLGAKVAIVEGTSFASVTAMTGVAATALENGDGSYGLREIAGAVIVAGLFCFLMAGIWGKMLKFFPHVVTGTVVTVIGVSLFPIGIRWIAGNNAAAEGAPIENIVLALVTLFIVLCINKFGKGIIANSSILIGVILGTVVAVLSDMLIGTTFFNIAPIKEAKLIGLPIPSYYGPPVFSVSASISFILVMLVIMTEATGNLIAVHNMSGKEIDEKNLAKGLRASGVSTMFSGFFNSYPVTAFGQNVGLLSMTGVFSRFVTVTAGIILTILAFFPKFAAVFAAVPKPVLGGVGFVMFGGVLMNGIRTLGNVDYNGNRNNLIVVVSIGLSLIPTVVPTFFKAFPSDASNILHSGITIGCISAILLNLFFNVFLAPKKAKEKVESEKIE